MYIPKDYIQGNEATIDAFIAQADFWTLTCNGDDGVPIGLHVPLIPKKIDDKWVLEGHLALANPMTRYLEQNRPILAIFQGAHGYISSSAYDHENVPSWNYSSVHLSCSSALMSEPQLEAHLAELTALYEGDRENAVRYEAFSQELLDDHLYQVRGFHLHVNKIEMASKLSQNRKDKDFNAIIDDLGKCPVDHSALIADMKATRKK